jgi:hypothetical protein
MHTYLADELQKIGMPAHKIICHTSSIELGEYLARDLPERQRCALVVAKGSQNTLWMEEVLAPLLKTPSDRHHLCRQSPWRQKKKKAYRRTIT